MLFVSICRTGPHEHTERKTKAFIFSSLDSSVTLTLKNATNESKGYTVHVAPGWVLIRHKLRRYQEEQFGISPARIP
ncbi:hypothetical protein JCM31598_34270 [Desulfonatronum parangueonense]